MADRLTRAAVNRVCDWCCRRLGNAQVEVVYAVEAKRAGTRRNLMRSCFPHEAAAKARSPWRRVGCGHVAKLIVKDRTSQFD